MKYGSATCFVLVSVTDVLSAMFLIVIVLPASRLNMLRPSRSFHTTSVLHVRPVSSQVAGAVAIFVFISAGL